MTTEQQAMSDNELNAAVARLLGWTFERPTWMGENNQHVYSPDGREVYINGPSWRTTVIGDSQLADVIPAYSTDVGAALEACWELGYRVVIDSNIEQVQLFKSSIAPFIRWHFDAAVGSKDIGRIIARALCEALVEAEGKDAN